MLNFNGLKKLNCYFTTATNYLTSFFFEERGDFISSGYFITATDTGVGKTVIATGIGMLLKEKGYDVGVMKPVQTGVVGGQDDFLFEDIRYLVHAVGCDDGTDLINPYSLKEPLAPSVAASMEGVSIEQEKICECFTILQSLHKIMIVEGVGGLLVPLRADYFVSDMILDFNLPVIVVTRPGIGTINHTLLTVKHLQSIGAPIAGIIINYAEEREQGLAEETNPGVIEELSGVPLLGVLPYIPCVYDEAQENKDLLQSMREHLDLETLVRKIR